ncbi:hypothetical protein FOA52_004609 [Chlamydomonas sp. UWO 241]|nr:hypothetical protein FOA52_004609 [Chlamydomonas sp. UWO 241]
MEKPAELWDTAEVCDYLQRIGLADLIPTFSKNEVVGEDLISLTDSELKADLDITRLQARRIKRYLDNGGASYTASEASTAEHFPRLRRCRAQLARYQQPTRTLSSPPPTSTTSACRAEASAASRSPWLGCRCRSSQRRFSRGPRPAVGVPVLMQPVQPAQVATCDPATVKQYHEMTNLIAKLEREQVAVRAPSVRAACDSLAKNIEGQNAKLQELLKAQAKTQAYANELAEGNWRPGKFIFKIVGKEEEKLNSAQADAMEADRKVAAVGKMLEGLHTQHTAKCDELNHLVAQTLRLNQAKAWETAILPQIFGGVNGDARENELERECDSIAPSLATARQYMASYSSAYELIRAAKRDLEQSAELLSHAVRMANADVALNFVGPGRRRGPMRSSPANVMVDVIKRKQSRQGSQLANKACAELVKVYSIIPDIPRIKLQQVKSLQGMMLMDIVFDNIVTDMIVRQKIIQALKLVEEIKVDTTYAERWVEGWLTGRVRPDLQGWEQKHAVTKASLDNHRRNLMNQMWAAQAEGGAPPAQAAQPMQPAAGIGASPVGYPGPSLI